MRTDITNAPAATAPAAARSAAPVLPPLPADVTELRFDELFKNPVGPRGLDLTDKLRALDGHRVRMLGHMVCEKICPDPALPSSTLPFLRVGNGTVPGRFLLTSIPQQTSYSHYGLCDDLPPQLVFVSVAESTLFPVAYVANPLLLTGVLSVGPQPELDGRISVVRLKLDPPPSAASLSSIPSTNNPPNP